MSSAALAAAIAAGDAVRGTTSPNPPVGAAIVSADGEIIGTGGTQAAGGEHAEIRALAQAGGRARGATAVVTLEPCNHTGRTGPCSRALFDAGIAEVHYVHPDPNPAAIGGAAWLAEQGLKVRRIDTRVDALHPWLESLRLGRPHVTLKFAQTLDGFTAAVDGTSQWITGEQARADVHTDRTRRDAIIVGTQTALTDNPSLTARDDRGELMHTQPRRVVIGHREVSERAVNLNRLGFEQYTGISEALTALWDSGARDVLVEGGAALAAGFIEADRADAIRAYIAPTLLGSGRGVLAGAQAETLADAKRFSLDTVSRLGDDVLVQLIRRERA